MDAPRFVRPGQAVYEIRVTPAPIDAHHHDEGWPPWALGR
jgi:hypothetical protein